MSRHLMNEQNLKVDVAGGEMSTLGASDVDIIVPDVTKSSPMLTFHHALMSTAVPGCQRAPTRVKYQTSLCRRILSFSLISEGT
jgi:hypothetical protein